MYNVGVWVTRTIKRPTSTNGARSISYLEEELAFQSAKLRKELEHVAKVHNIVHMDDWYRLTGKEYAPLLGTKFKHQYDNSPSQVLSFAFPDYDWLPWRFRRCPPNFWDKPRNQRRYMNWAAKELNITEMSGWYQIENSQFLKVGGGSILQRYNVSLSQALLAIYPEYDWLPWKFHYIPSHTWADFNNHKKFIEHAAIELNIKELSDWYNVTCDDLIKLGGNGLLFQNTMSVYQVLLPVYPEYDWLPWKFDKCPLLYFEDIVNQRKFMHWAANELKINDLEDWYKVDADELVKLGGGQMVRKYSSLYKLLVVAYPNYDWLPWKFDKSPTFWIDPENQRKFIEWAGKQLGVVNMSDWYNITNQQLIELGGTYLIKNYNRSRPKLFSALYPDYEWLTWKFLKKPIAKDMRNQSKLFADSVAIEKNILQPSDWYKVTVADLRQIKGGDTILRAFEGSIYKFLVSAYPDVHWFPWRFSPEYFSDSSNWNRFVESISKELKIKELKDWYNVETERIIELGGGALLIKHNSLGELLSFVYPNFNWEISRFPDIWTNWGVSNCLVDWLKQQSRDEISLVHNVIKERGVKGLYPLIEALRTAFPDFQWFFNPGKKKTQFMLKYCLADLFKNEVLLEEYKHPDFGNLELDYFYPQLNLAIEYQGQQHYREVGMYNTNQSIDEFRYRDMQKAQACRKNGITLVEIPYWWDRKLSSLEATIYHARPDLFAKKEKPKGIVIPFSKKEPLVIKSIFRDYLMIPIEWEKEKTNPTGWYITEKYDGMRLYWSGSNFYTRQGKKLNLPESFARHMPPIALDGELWTQYGLYQDAANLPKISNEEKWKKAVYWIFDSPENPDLPLEKRMEYVRQLDLPPYVRIVDFVRCEGEEHMRKFTAEVAAKGGEGIVLREPGSLYKPGKSKSVLKFKPFFDTEVKVVVNQYPYGFICEQTIGKRCFVKISDEVLPDARYVQIGDIITVKHNGANVHGTLMFPQFYRVRLDVTWEELNKASV